MPPPPRRSVFYLYQVQCRVEYSTILWNFSTILCPPVQLQVEIRSVFVVSFIAGFQSESRAFSCRPWANASYSFFIKEEVSAMRNVRQKSHDYTFSVYYCRFPTNADHLLDIMPTPITALIVFSFSFILYIREHTTLPVNKSPLFNGSDY